MPHSAHPSDDDDDALLSHLEASLESDPALAHLRESRIQALSHQLAQRKSLHSQGFGTYTHPASEKDLLHLTTSVNKCIVHFYHPSFHRCSIMDEHLGNLAESHLETRFLRMDVEKAPFLVEKLGVKVLPCVIGFVDGVGLGRIVGFEGIEAGDSCKTGDVEEKLVGMGVLERVEGLAVDIGGGRRAREEREEVAEDEGDDWD